MFLSKRKIKGKEYFYLEERLGSKRLSIFLGEKKDLSEKLESAFDSLVQKKVVHNAKNAKQQYKQTNFSFEELVSLDKLKLSFKLLKTFFPQGFESFEKDEFVRYAQGSASVEGNSLNLAEATLVLEKGATVSGKKIDEIKEIENMQKAATIASRIKKIDERSILKIHAAIMSGFEEKSPGKFREEPVFIQGSKVRPPSADIAKSKMEELVTWLEKNKKKIHPVELASAFHARFEEIHPFSDGNGRTGRVILNIMLQKEGFPRAIINLENRESYIVLLERVQRSKEYKKFTAFIYSCLQKKSKEIQQLLTENKKTMLTKLMKKRQNAG